MAVSLGAQTITKIDILPGERWWGCATDLGRIMPFTEGVSIDFRTQNFNNQTSPLLVSSCGRYIWSESLTAVSFAEGCIRLTDRGDAATQCVQAGGTMREAFLAASAACMPPTGTIPPEEFFRKPQYNTWIELVYNQNQADVLAYAHAIVDNGFPTGILMIDDNWQKYYGNFEFRPDRFPNPKAMIDELHALGFKVMLWVCPFVSPDSAEYRYLRDRNYLIRRADGSGPAVLDWWNGLSACFDLSNPEAADYLYNTLRQMQTEYGVDGFKFDAGDPERYCSEQVDVFDGKSYDVAQTRLWAELGARFAYNEFRACWTMGGQPLVQRLGDKKYSWEGIASLVPSMIAAGLLGYAYACPDMIGGGEYGSFIGIDPDEFDQRLIVRSCQIHSMMPMMQFSVAPWRILSSENLAICLRYAKWHTELGDYIISQAKSASLTGEPIVRHLAYMFPNEGFEECTDQYMLGDEYLVAPVTDARDTRTVRLPKGRWRDDEGRTYRGGRTYTLSVPIERLPWFKRVK